MFKAIIITILALSTLVSCQIKSGDNLSPNNSSNDAALKTTPSHFNTIIAEIVNDQIVFSQNMGDIINEWEDVASESPSLELKIWNYYIEIEDGKYYIVGEDSIAPAISKICLVLDNGKFYEELYPGQSVGAPPSGTSCTCSGCTSTGPGSIGECEPKGSDLTGWYCTDCSEGTCTKSTTTTTGGVLSL